MRVPSVVRRERACVVVIRSSLPWSLGRGQRSAFDVRCVVKILAGRTGLEPAASGVTGRRYNQLNYRPVTARGT